MRDKTEPERWYTPAEVARRFSVDAKTVTRWAQSGTIPAEHIIRTLGRAGPGHRRYRASFIDQLLNGGGRS
jgi:predicted site-specific integrase-resolvase